MPADAITWAISPPMVPAPTTAALNTNMSPPVGWRLGTLAQRPLPPRPPPRSGVSVRRSESRSARRMKMASATAPSGPVLGELVLERSARPREPASLSTTRKVCVPTSRSSKTMRRRTGPGRSSSATFSVTRPRPGRASTPTRRRAPAAGQSELTLERRGRSPPRSVGQRSRSVHRRSAASGVSGDIGLCRGAVLSCRTPRARSRRSTLHRVEERPHLLDEPLVLRLGPSSVSE